MDNLDPVTFGGRTVDRRTAAMLREALRIANEKDPEIGNFRLTQGSWSHAGASAGTHKGPGAFDMYTAGWTDKQKEIIGLALREVGFASWLRSPSQGPWQEHWHGIAMGTKGLPQISQNQVRAYRDGRDGLAGNGKDDQPRPETIRTWEEYQQQASTRDEAGTEGQPEAAGDHDRAGTDPYDIQPGRPPDVDNDGDGLTDAFEQLLGTDAHTSDTDGDGLNDAEEVVRFHTDPLSVDTDSDEISDASELEHGTDPGRAAPLTHGRDSDGDSLPNAYEDFIGTSSKVVDTDGDGMADSLELSVGTSPLKLDTDGDGVSDWLERSATASASSMPGGQLAEQSPA